MEKIDLLIKYFCDKIHQDPPLTEEDSNEILSRMIKVGLTTTQEKEDYMNENFPKDDT